MGVAGGLPNIYLKSTFYLHIGSKIYFLLAYWAQAQKKGAEAPSFRTKCDLVGNHAHEASQCLFGSTLEAFDFEAGSLEITKDLFFGPSTFRVVTFSFATYTPSRTSFERTDRTDLPTATAMSSTDVPA